VHGSVGMGAPVRLSPTTSDHGYDAVPAERVRELDKAGKEQRRRHAQEVGDLKAAAAVSASQVLALRNAELEADNRRQVAQLAPVEAALIPMADRT
jgi:hypothetical protein